MPKRPRQKDTILVSSKHKAEAKAKKHKQPWLNDEALAFMKKPHSWGGGRNLSFTSRGTDYIVELGPGPLSQGCLSIGTEIEDAYEGLLQPLSR